MTIADKPRAILVARMPQSPESFALVGTAETRFARAMTFITLMKNVGAMIASTLLITMHNWRINMFRSILACISSVICGLIICLAPVKNPPEAVVEPSTSVYKSLGTFELTAYCPCSKCNGKWAGGMTSTGVRAKAGRTIAVDPKVIPYGTEVIINGHVYVAEDCGGAIKGNKLDIYFDTHAEALEFGRQKAEVFIEVR